MLDDFVDVPDLALIVKVVCLRSEQQTGFAGGQHLEQRQRRRDDAHIVLAIMSVGCNEAIDGFVSAIVHNKPVDVQPHHVIELGDVVLAL